MNDGVRLLGAFAIGLLGWLAVGGAALTDIWLVLAAFLVGMLAALITQRIMALPGLLLGVAASYPAAVALQMISFVAETWPVHVIGFLVLATIGFLAIVLGRVLIKTLGL